MKNSKFKYVSLEHLLEDNRFIAVLSVLLSFVIWLGMSMSTEDEFTKKITNIPISINLSDEAKNDNLQVFNSTEAFAEVSVTGNRISVGSLTSNDIQITAQQATAINSPGNYTLELSAKKLGVKSDYDFTSTINPSFVIVTVDRYREKTFSITNNLNYNVKEGFYESATVYSQAEVIVSGPETEVSKVAKVAVVGKISDELKETVTENHQLVMLDEYDDVIKSDFLSLSISSVDVTLPIGAKKSVPLTVTVKNGNSLIINSEIISIEPSTIEVSAPLDVFENIEELDIGTIDLSKVNLLTKAQELSVELPAGWKNIGNITSATVKFNTSGYSVKKLTVTNFKFKNLDISSTANSLTKALEVTVIGKSDIIQKITKDNVVAIIDLESKGKDYSGTVELPAIIDITNVPNCWAYGDYFCDVEISVKDDE